MRCFSIRASPNSRRIKKTMAISPPITGIPLENIFETGGKHIGIAMLFAGALTSIVTCIKRVYKKYKEKQTHLQRISESLITLEREQKNLRDIFSASEETWLKKCDEDQKIRTSLYMGQVAVISAVRELAEHQGLKINGPVQMYYEQNIEALKTGFGLMHSHKHKEIEHAE